MWLQWIRSGLYLVFVAYLNRNMIEVNERGGARIGMTRATWPFATLKVTKDKLELDVSLVDNLVFAPEDIVAIVPCSGLFTKGLRIIHRVSKYREAIIFWPIKNYEDLIKGIEQTGFLVQVLSHRQNYETIINQDATNNFPIKLPAIAAFVAIWYIIFQDFWIYNPNIYLRIAIQIALILLIATCILLITLEPFRNLVLRDGLTLKDIKKPTLITSLVGGLTLLLVTIFM